MSAPLLVPVDMYQDAQWRGLVDDMRGLITEGLHTRENFVTHHAIKRGFTYTEARAALIEAEELQ